MTDIVERLRSHPGIDQSVTQQFRNMHEQRNEAAAEIERLQTANEYAWAEIARVTAVGDKAILACRNEIQDLRAEIERLLALLTLALPYVDGPTEPGPSLRAAINEAISGD